MNEETARILFRMCVVALARKWAYGYGADFVSPCPDTLAGMPGVLAEKLILRPASHRGPRDHPVDRATRANAADAIAASQGCGFRDSRIRRKHASRRDRRGSSRRHETGQLFRPVFEQRRGAPLRFSDGQSAGT